MTVLCLIRTVRCPMVSGCPPPPPPITSAQRPWASINAGHQLPNLQCQHEALVFCGRHEPLAGVALNGPTPTRPPAAQRWSRSILASTRVLMRVGSVAVIVCLMHGSSQVETLWKASYPSKCKGTHKAPGIGHDLILTTDTAQDAMPGLKPVTEGPSTGRHAQCTWVLLLRHGAYLMDVERIAIYRASDFIVICAQHGLH